MKLAQINNEIEIYKKELAKLYGKRKRLLTKDYDKIMDAYVGKYYTFRSLNEGSYVTYYKILERNYDEFKIMKVIFDSVNGNKIEFENVEEYRFKDDKEITMQDFIDNFTKVNTELMTALMKGTNWDQISIGGKIAHRVNKHGNFKC